MSHVQLRVGSMLAGVLLLAAPLHAQVRVEPASQSEQTEFVEFAAVDVGAARAEDETREAQGLPSRFAIVHPVEITPDTAGVWDQPDEKTLRWQFRVICKDALSVNLGFTRYSMPDGGSLLIQAADGSHALRPFTARDNKAHGQLWTPVVLADDVLVELTIPAESKDGLDLKLTAINQGYRFFGEKADDGPRQGYCNIDVICPQGDDWRDDIQSVAAIKINGSWMCTGFMVNNTNEDETPYFMTANHCGVTSSSDATLVCYWNFHSPTCGALSGGPQTDYQSGSTHLASYSSSDFTIVLLDDDPDPSWNVTFAGWSRSSANPTSAVAIHHPGVDEKAISFENQACTTTDYLGTSTPGDGTHVRVIDWDLGTTEGGSSGSPLFDQNHHVVGQLHGGYAACGNDDSDWYGRLSVSWTHGLSTYLDPGSTGATTLDLLVPGAVGLKVTPSSDFQPAGDSGGPFTPSSEVYMLENLGGTGIDYTVSKSESWLSLDDTGGYLPASGVAYVTVSLNSAADSLNDGFYTDTVQFTNTTDHVGDTSRGVSLEVGGPALVYSFTLNTDPGWTAQGLWAWGDPTGASAEHGNSDPDSGYTGDYVYGYNLNGDYVNNMAETHLTTTAIDCSDMGAASLKFHRWLGVERSLYDHAYVRVSNDGTNWVTVWQNGVEMLGGAWESVEYDISAVADGEETVYIRWTMGSTDGSWLYCGWNIDDVEIWGIVTSTASCVDGILNQGEDRIDCGGPCPACDCTSDGACSNSVFCDGVETCDDYGHCQSGSDPCSGFDWCDEIDGCYDCGTADGNMDGTGGTNGLDIQPFVDAAIGISTRAADVCPGDFNRDGVVSIEDTADFVNALLGA